MKIVIGIVIILVLLIIILITILKEQMEEFCNWYRCLDVIPRIGKIKEEVATDLDLRLYKILHQLPMEVFEKETLEKVVAARNAAQGASGIADKVQAENALQGTLRSLFAVAEAYPDLKANTNFLDLQDQLKYVEEDIANARKFYNAVVKQYNNKCEMFPSIFHFERMPMFEVSAPEQRENVKVQF